MEALSTPEYYCIRCFLSTLAPTDTTHRAVNGKGLPESLPPVALDLRSNASTCCSGPHTAPHLKRERSNMSPPRGGTRVCPHACSHLYSTFPEHAPYRFLIGKREEMLDPIFRATFLSPAASTIGTRLPSV